MSEEDHGSMDMESQDTCQPQELRGGVQQHRGHCGHEVLTIGIPCVARQPVPSALRWNHVTDAIC